MNFAVLLTVACNFFKKETLAQLFSCEFCKTFRNTFFTEYIWKTLLDLRPNENFSNQT